MLASSSTILNRERIAQLALVNKNARRITHNFLAKKKSDDVSLTAKALVQFASILRHLGSEYEEAIFNDFEAHNFPIQYGELDFARQVRYLKWIHKKMTAYISAAKAFKAAGAHLTLRYENAGNKRVYSTPNNLTPSEWPVFLITVEMTVGPFSFHVEGELTIQEIQISQIFIRIRGPRYLDVIPDIEEVFDLYLPSFKTFWWEMLATDGLFSSHPIRNSSSRIPISSKSFTALERQRLRQLIAIFRELGADLAVHRRLRRRARSPQMKKQRS